MGAVKPVFRASSPEDREAIVTFLKQVFGSDPREPYLQPAHMQWKYWQPSPGWEGSRSFLLEREGNIVAHGAAWPLTILTPEGSVSAFNLIDWAASPKLPGSGTYIMKRMAELADVVCVFEGTEIARQMRTAMGFRPRNDVHVMARPLRPVRQILSHQRKNWKSPARLLRNLKHSFSGGAPSAGWEASPVSAPEIALDVFAQPSGLSFVFQQDQAVLRYQAGCPTAESQFYSVTHEGAQVGFFHLMLVPGHARIAEASVKGGRPDFWKQLYRLAVSKAKENKNVHEIVAFAPTAVMREALASAGFRTHHHEPVLIFDPKRRIPEEAQLQMQMIQSDAAFWHPRGANYLT
jgi:hypothetical protein